jgi:orotidine-5'-phosphate decarboxylase
LGVLVLLDAKRSDIGSTACAYAAYLERDGALPADAITVNPYLGRDTLEPFIAAAQHNGGGVFVLVKTSNPGAGDYQDRRVDGRPLFEHVAESLRETAERLRGPATGWSSLGLVAGATYPAENERLRQLLPPALFLVPGYGAQGGGAADAVRGFVPGPTGCLEGGIVNSSRALLFPADAATDDAGVWERAIDDACDRAVAELRAAVA